MATFTLSRRMSEWKHLSPSGESEECAQRRFVLSECVFNLSLWRTRLNSSRDDSRYLNWRSGASRSRSAADKREPLRLGAAWSLLTDLRDDSSPHKHMFRPQVCLCFLMYVFLPFFFWESADKHLLICSAFAVGNLSGNLTTCRSSHQTNNTRTWERKRNKRLLK